MTSGYWASLYRCGTDASKVDDGVVTETSFPDRSGSNADRKGSALCLVTCTYRSSAIERTCISAISSNLRKVLCNNSRGLFRRQRT